MFGFVIGALSLYGLLRVLGWGGSCRRHGGWGSHRRCEGGGRWRHGRHGGHGHHRHHGDVGPWERDGHVDATGPQGWDRRGGDHHGWDHGDGDHRGWDHRGWDHRGWDHGGGDHDSWAARRGPGRWLRGLFVRLDTTPGQEKVMRQAAEELSAAGTTLAGELAASRREVAEAVRSGTVDAEKLGALFARHDEKLRELRTGFVGAIAKVTDALDEDQRKRLAELIDRGEGMPGLGGPYRHQ